MIRLILLIALIGLAGCRPLAAVPPSAAPTWPAPSVTPFASPAALAVAVPTSTPAATPTFVPTPMSLPKTATPTLAGGVEYNGVEPPNDYTRARVNGEELSRRTLWMLEQAQALYRGPGNILSVMQGSYTPGLKESFGTHDGGGAVDISVRNPANPGQVLLKEAPKMVAAMRQVGFAAWYRPADLLGPGSAPHIHAIAIGDADLSPAARGQIDGPEGYLRGLDGLPPKYGGPHPDPHGGPIICLWMIKLGLKDLRP